MLICPQSFSFCPHALIDLYIITRISQVYILDSVLGHAFIACNSQLSVESVFEPDSEPHCLDLTCSRFETRSCNISFIVNYGELRFNQMHLTLDILTSFRLYIQRQSYRNTARQPVQGVARYHNLRYLHYNFIPKSLFESRGHYTWCFIRLFREYCETG